MKYLMLVIGLGSGDEPERAAVRVRAAHPEIDVEDWASEMDGRGVRQFGDRVRPGTDASTVRVRDGDVLVSDGPFAESWEQMAGFDVLECADLDEAIEVASRHPMAREGMIELRPFWPLGTAG